MQVPAYLDSPKFRLQIFVKHPFFKDAVDSEIEVEIKELENDKGTLFGSSAISIIHSNVHNVEMLFCLNDFERKRNAASWKSITIQCRWESQVTGAGNAVRNAYTAAQSRAMHVTLQSSVLDELHLGDSLSVQNDPAESWKRLLEKIDVVYSIVYRISEVGV